VRGLHHCPACAAAGPSLPAARGTRAWHQRVRSLAQYAALPALPRPPACRVRRPCRACAPRSARSAPAARTRTCSGAGSRRQGSPRSCGGAAHAHCHAAPRPKYVCWPAGAVCWPWARSAAQPSSLVASTLHERADHTLGALAARVRRWTLRTAEASGACALLCRQTP